MRKALLFLLLLGGGLTALYLVGRWRDLEHEKVIEVVPLPPPDEGRAPLVPIPTRPGETSQEAPGAQLGGYARYNIRDENRSDRPRLYDFEALDVQPLEDGRHELKALTVVYYNPDTGTERARLSAERGLARIAFDGRQLRFVGDEPTRLFACVLALYEDSPFVPLTVRVPELEADIERGVFDSEAPVTLEGSGMNAGGTGLEVREERGVLRLLKHGQVDLWLDATTRAELTATGEGALVLRRLPASGLGAPEPAWEQASVEAQDGALFVMEGRDPLRCESQSIVIRGRYGASAAGRRFTPSEAEAHGAAVLHRGPDEFSGELARLAFRDDGRMQQATLLGQPLAKVWIEGAVPARRTQLVLSGRGPLVTRFLPEAGFEMGGPAAIEVPELDLRADAAERIAGGVDRDAHKGELDLVGSVAGRFGRDEYEGRDLHLTAGEDERGETLVIARSEAPARIAGVDARERAFVVDTLRELRMNVGAGGLIVPIARETTIHFQGEGGFHASAGVLRDFDGERGTFDARRGVVYESTKGKASADRIVSHGGEHLELFGLVGDPAQLELKAGAVAGVAGGTARAQRIEAMPGVVRAEGAALLELDAKDGRNELECEWVELVWGPAGGAGDAEGGDGAPPAPQPFRIEARTVTHSIIRGEFGRAGIVAHEVVVEGLDTERAGAPEQAAITRVAAEGEVEIDFEDAARLVGSGERFTWTRAAGGTLFGAPGARAHAWGRLSVQDLPYRMDAERIGFGAVSVEALRPRIELDPPPFPPADEEQGQDVLTGATAEWMGADRAGILFAGDAHLVGRLRSGREWRLDAGSVHVVLGADSRQPGLNRGPIESAVAWDGFTVHLGEDVEAEGDILEADFRTLRMEGAPARLRLLGITWASPQIDYDLIDTLVRTEQGSVVFGDGTRLAGWTVRYESLQPFEDPDSTVLVLRNPRFSRVDREVRAAWALFWVDRDHWRASTDDWLGPAGGAAPGGGGQDAARTRAQERAAQEGTKKPISLFGEFDANEISDLLTEVYVEGDVEYLVESERKARMDAVYIDMLDGHGWLKGAEVFVDAEVHGVPERLVVRADWLRHSADGSLRADSAIVTSCQHAAPHYHVRTKDLRLTPSQEEGVGWTVSARKNSLRFANGLALPLPPIRYQTDSEGKPLFSRLAAGNSARFGQFVQASFNLGLGAVGAGVAKAAAVDRKEVAGDVLLHTSYLGSRGILIGTGVEARVGEDFWVNLYLEGIPDRSRDRGLVRADKADRPTVRHFLHGRARYTLAAREWFDFAFAQQSDEGVQAEYFENEFLRYEEKDTFVHWRKAEDENYLSASVKVRLDDFRSDAEELPSLGVYRGLVPVSSIDGLPLLYTGYADLEYLGRRIGDGASASPFDPDYGDGLGQRDVLRLDTEHRVELPYDLDRGGWVATPFAGARATGWSEGSEPDGRPSRGAAFAGVDLGTTLLRTFSGGLVNSFAPSFGARADLGSFTDGTPIPTDAVERPIDGSFVDAGVRAKWFVPGADERLELDLRGTYAVDAGGAQDGWQPVAVLGEFLTRVGDVPVAMSHDGRYDLEDSATVFSRTRLGFEPFPDVGIELGYSRGLDDLDVRLYEAATVATRWRATQKWEFEGRHTIDLDDNGSLDSRLTLRRFGHDLILDLELGSRSGEGSFFSIGLKPLLGWKPSRVGLIDRWIGDE